MSHSAENDAPDVTLTEAERATLSEVIYATWPDDQWERLKFLEREVEGIIANRTRPIPPGKDQS